LILLIAICELKDLPVSLYSYYQAFYTTALNQGGGWR